MKKILLVAALLALAPIAFADPDLGQPERGPIRGGNPVPPGREDGRGGNNGGNNGGDNGGDVDEGNGGDSGRVTGAFTCRLPGGHFDAVCVNNETGHVMKFDHASVVTENSACEQVRYKVYSCAANFLRYTNDVAPGDIL